jgi:hypothetical protein
MQYAVQLRKRLVVLPRAQRRVEDIPIGLAALIEKSWQRIAVDPIAVDGLGILAAAREALTLDGLGTVAGWTGEAQRRAFVRAAKELLVETLRPGGQPEYRLHHDSIRGYIARAIGEVALRAHHGALTRRHATWPVAGQAVARRYALRHALIHRAEAGDWITAWQLAAGMSFLEAKCCELGVHETEVDVARVAERCRASGDAVLSRRFGDLARALGRESHWLRAAPEATTALVWNRLRRSGWSATELDGELRVPALASFLRVRHAITRESPALVRELVGHSGSVTACMLTADGRRVATASEDRTLKVWDLGLDQLPLMEPVQGSVLCPIQGYLSAPRLSGLWPDMPAPGRQPDKQLVEPPKINLGRVLPRGHRAADGGRRRCSRRSLATPVAPVLRRPCAHRRRRDARRNDRRVQGGHEHRVGRDVGLPPAGGRVGEHGRAAVHRQPLGQSAFA